MLKYLKIKNNLVHKTALINWKKIKIGKGNVFGPYVVIGNRPQWPKKKSNGYIYIGNNNFFNEYCNVHLPTKLTKKTIFRYDFCCFFYKKEGYFRKNKDRYQKQRPSMFYHTYKCLRKKIKFHLWAICGPMKLPNYKFYFWKVQT